jgi:hypothetical protein
MLGVRTSQNLHAIAKPGYPLIVYRRGGGGENRAKEKQACCQALKTQKGYATRYPDGTTKLHA